MKFAFNVVSFLVPTHNVINNNESTLVKTLAFYKQTE